MKFMNWEEQIEKQRSKVPHYNWEKIIIIELVYVIFINFRRLIWRVPSVLRLQITQFRNIFRIDKTIKFPNITNSNEMFGPDTFVPVSVRIDGIDRFQNIIEYTQGFSFRDTGSFHVCFKVRFISFTDESKQAFVRNWYGYVVDMVGKGHTVHVRKYLFIVLEGFIKSVLLKFVDGEYFSVVNITILILCVE